MDQDRFDALTKELAGRRTRRGVLGGLAAGVAALAFGRGTAGANPPPKKCKYQGSNCNGNADCCTLNCCNRTCCGDGQICANGQCVFPTTTPAPTTTTPAPTTTTPAPTTTTTTTPVPVTTTTTTPKPTTTTTPAPDLCAGVTCPPSDQCHAPGKCDPATGKCSSPVLADYTPCDDGNPCTANDQCFSGFCKGTPVSCPTGATCDPSSGCVCGSGLTSCPTGCVDTKSDPSNCGACGVICTSPAHGNSTCSSGSCVVTCIAGFQSDGNGGCVAASPCPAGYEALNGGCFLIDNTRDLSLCGSTCNGVFGSIEGSGNYLCARYQGWSCSVSSDCPTGSACYADSYYGMSYCVWAC